MSKKQKQGAFPTFAHFRADLLGGLTAGVVALPLALAFGVQSGMGAVAGLYGAIFIGFFASLFGGTATQISGPTAPMTAVSMLVVAGMVQLFDGNLQLAIPSILFIFLLAGLIQIGLGILGAGSYIKYIPYPVVSGFMSGIGLIIIITQLCPLVGYYPSEDAQLISSVKPLAEEILLEKILRQEAAEDILVLEDFKQTIERANEISSEDIQKESEAIINGRSAGVIGSFRYIPKAIKHINIIELLLALATLLVIYGSRWLKIKFPGSLIALLVVSLIAVVSGVSYHNIGLIPMGFPEIHLDMFQSMNWDVIRLFILSSITLAFLGAIDSLLTSVVADNLTKTRHNPRKELIGQGIGNSIAALFGGIPGAGATIRTVVNIHSGGTTKLSGLIASILLLITLLLLAPIAERIPAAVLVGILCSVGIGVMDYRGLKAIPHMPLTDVFIMIIVLLLTVFWNVIYAVAIGLVVAALVFMKRMGDYSAAQSEVFVLDDQKWADEEEFPSELLEEVYIKHISGPLFFGATSEFSRLALEVPNLATHVVLRMERVPFIDQSGLYAMEDMIKAYQSRGIQVLISGLTYQPLHIMKAGKVIPHKIKEEHVFQKFKECMNYVKKNVTDYV